MKPASSRKLSPKSINQIDADIINLFEKSTFSDDVTRLSVEMRAVELMKEKEELKHRLESIANAPIEWQESKLEIYPRLDLYKKNQFIFKAQKELSTWKRKLQALQYKAKSQKAYFGERLSQKVAMLNTRKDFLHLKLNEIKASSSKQWVHIKNQYDLRRREFKMAFQETVQELQQ